MAGDINRVSGIFSLVIGSSMILMWLFILLFDNIPEFRSDPLQIVLHLTAEFLTGVLLISAGIALLRRKSSGAKLFYLASGMLLYTVIVSSGYYADRREWLFVLMFGVIFIMTTILLVIRIVKERERETLNV